MENKQTAVQWLLQNIPDLGKYIPFGVSMKLHAKFQQALELEKQQHEATFEAGYRDLHGSFDEYYSETYKPETDGE